MDTPPSFFFSGNIEKSISLKAQAHQFYNNVCTQAKIGGVLFLSRNKTLADGSTISVTTKSEGNFGIRTGVVSIFTISDVSKELDEIYTLEFLFPPIGSPITALKTIEIAKAFTLDLSLINKVDTKFTNYDLVVSDHVVYSSPVVSVLDKSLIAILPSVSISVDIRNIMTNTLIMTYTKQIAALLNHPQLLTINGKIIIIEEISTQTLYRFSYYTNSGVFLNSYDYTKPVHYTESIYKVAATSNIVLYGAGNSNQTDTTVLPLVTAFTPQIVKLWDYSLPLNAFRAMCVSRDVCFILEKRDYTSTTRVIKVLSNTNGSVVGELTHPVDSTTQVNDIQVFKNNLYLLVASSSLDTSYIAHYAFTTNPFTYILLGKKHTSSTNNVLDRLIVDTTIQ